MQFDPEYSRGAASKSYLDSPRFAVEFDYYWKQLSAGMETLVSDEELEVLHYQALLKENSFYSKVTTTVREAMLQAKGPVVCLFDVDGTIAEMKDDDTSSIHMLLRPSLTPLISELAIEYPEILRFGLLSLRPMDSLRDEANNPTFLSATRAFIDDTLIYSSEGTLKNDPLIMDDPDNEAIGTFLDSMQAIIGEQTIAEARQHLAHFFRWYDPKLKVIHDLMAHNPDTTYVVVDNLAYAGKLNLHNPKLYGICVQDEEQLLIPT